MERERIDTSHVCLSVPLGLSMRKDWRESHEDKTGQDRGGQGRHGRGWEAGGDPGFLGLGKQAGLPCLQQAAGAVAGVHHSPLPLQFNLPFAGSRRALNYLAREVVESQHNWQHPNRADCPIPPMQ